MHRAFYSNTIKEFLRESENEILGRMSIENPFALEQLQRDAWIEEVHILKLVLKNFNGSIYLEYSIPRMGQRIDAVVIINSVVLVIEFKIGEREFHTYAVDQVWDYALDLKNFHETSHDKFIAPILVATNAKVANTLIAVNHQDDKLLLPIKSNTAILEETIRQVVNFSDGSAINYLEWEAGRYCPTPTIIEAAKALYNNHSVEDISRSDASAINLSDTSNEVASIIRESKEKMQKSICFVTGVPGAGKTLVGLHIATTHFDKSNELYSVFLSGNGPLVAILREALARDKVQRIRESGGKIKKGEALSEVKLFIQNVHHFRDECLIDSNSPPIEHVALFDEAQRAWNLEQTKSFMLRKKNIPGFNQSEPEFLISCLDRHNDWAVIVCLVGGGQEINTGEAGISEWIRALEHTFTDWKIFISSQIYDSEYSAIEVLERLKTSSRVKFRDNLHLAVSMRSFRAENVSLFVKQLLDIKPNEASSTLKELGGKYPIVITRDLVKAKRWLKMQARGSERYGIIVSSQAERLRPHAINVKAPMNPINWFLDGKDDVRSSFYLEDVATEFDIQGLELDWVCVTWDADFRFENGSWSNWSFRGNKWQRINKPERKLYQKNAYRVLLTRARQGMVIVVPEGDQEDNTRSPEFYNSTYRYLKQIGISELE
jgi:hypothetical protein